MVKSTVLRTAVENALNEQSSISPERSGASPYDLRWVGFEEAGAVAEARLLSYAPGRSELPNVLKRTTDDRRAKDGDFLLLYRNGRIAGTTTSYSMTMYVRGAAMPCQGVAWVGTVRTERRKGNPNEPGVATLLMKASLERARERGEVLSALMPFRASFYEHFGYGLVERRGDWLIPMPCLPAGDTEGLRFYERGDFDAVLACKNRISRAGQCEFERIGWTMQHWLDRAEDGFVIVDRPDDAGAVRGWLAVHTITTRHDQKIAKVSDHGAQDTAALLRQLRFLGALKDQYNAAEITLPADLQLNRLLKEPQLPHRPVQHATAACKAYTRMQVRVLDHKRLLEAVPLPADVSGAVTVAVQECEGTVSRFRVEVDGGRAMVKPAGGEATFSCKDTTWAAIATGDLAASAAVRLGLATGETALLDAYAQGPAPFTIEHF